MSRTGKFSLSAAPQQVNAAGLHPVGAGVANQVAPGKNLPYVLRELKRNCQSPKASTPRGLGWSNINPVEGKIYRNKFARPQTIIWAAQ